MSASALTCFLCHGMVQFTDKDLTDFSSHMTNQHKAFFNMELSLAVPLMNEEESRAVIKGQLVWKYGVKILDIDVEELLTSNTIKHENYGGNACQKKFYNKKVIGEDEYIEDEETPIKQETLFSPHSDPILNCKDVPEKGESKKIYAKEMIKDKEPKDKKQGPKRHKPWPIQKFKEFKTIEDIAVSQSVRNFQKFSEIFRNFQKFSESFRKFQKVSESFRKFHKVSESLKYFRKFQKVIESFRKFRKFQKISETFRKF